MAGAQDQNPSSCLDIPAVLAGKDDLGSVHSCSGSLFHDSYVSLAPKVAKVEVTLQDGTPDAGSSFFVGDGTHLVTNSHVVENSRELQISYNGKHYAAKIEKLDDINDLAELKVLGLDADAGRAQNVGQVSLSGNERVISVGVPGVHNQDKYINPGVMLNSNRLYNIFTDPRVNDTASAKQITDAFNSGDPVLKQMAQDRANSPRLIINQGARPGDSGSPIDDAQGNLVGVVTAVNGNNATIDVPFTKVQDLLNNPETKFNFNYAEQTKYVMPSLTDGAINTAGLGVEVAGILGAGKFAPLAYAGVKTISLAEEVKDLTQTNDADKKHGLEVGIAQDAAMVAGGTLATFAWSSPVGRAVGLGAMGLSLASRFITNSQEKHYVLNGITRQNGDTHKPWQD